MENGRVDEQHSGPPDTVLPWLDQQHRVDTQSGGERERVDTQSGEERERVDTQNGEEKERVDTQIAEERERGKGREKKSVDTPNPQLDHTTLESTIDPLAITDLSPSCDTSGGGASREHALVQEEEKEVGVVAVSVYLAYCAAVGTVLTPAILVALFLMQGTYISIPVIERFYRACIVCDLA